MVTTGNTRPVIVFVNIEQNFLFFCVLETWPQERKLCLSLFILRNGCPLNIGFSAEQNFQNELPIIILSTILIFGNIGNLKKKTIVSVKKILEKWYIYYCVKVYYKLVISGLSYLFIWIVIFNKYHHYYFILCSSSPIHQPDHLLFWSQLQLCQETLWLFKWIF